MSAIKEFKLINKITARYSNLSIQARATFAYLLVSFLQKGLAFVTTPIYTRMLTTEEFGEVAVYYSMQALLEIVALFALNNGVFDVAMVDYKEQRTDYVKSSLVLSNIITILTAFALILLSAFVKVYLNIPPELMILMFAVFLVKPAFWFWSHWQRFEYHYKAPVILTGIIAIIAPVVSIFLIKTLDDYHLYARILGVEVPALVVYLVFYFKIWGSPGKVNKSFMKYAFTFNLPLLPHYLSAYILSGSDRLMIAGMLGNTEAAFYSMASTIGMVILVVWEAINSAIAPVEMEKQSQCDYKGLRRFIQPILLLFAIMCMGLMLLAPEFLKVLATEPYYVAVYAIPPIVGGVFFQALYSIFSDALYYWKKPVFVMLGSITSALLNLLLNYLLIPKYGFVVAGYTTLFSYFVQAIFDFIVMKKVVGNNIYSIKYICCVSCAVIGFVIGATLLYDSNILRYMTIMIVAFILLKNRRKVYYILKKE